MRVCNGHASLIEDAAADFRPGPLSTAARKTLVSLLLAAAVS